MKYPIFGVDIVKTVDDHWSRQQISMLDIRRSIRNTKY